MCFHKYLLALITALQPFQDKDVFQLERLDMSDPLDYHVRSTQMIIHQIKRGGIR